LNEIEHKKINAVKFFSPNFKAENMENCRKNAKNLNAGIC